MAAASSMSSPLSLWPSATWMRGTRCPASASTFTQRRAEQWQRCRPRCLTRFQSMAAAAKPATARAGIRKTAVGGSRGAPNLVPPAPTPPRARRNTGATRRGSGGVGPTWYRRPSRLSHHRCVCCHNDAAGTAPAATLSRRRSNCSCTISRKAVSPMEVRNVSTRTVRFLEASRWRTCHAARTTLRALARCSFRRCLAAANLADTMPLSSPAPGV
mmetsp:Transcript_72756/g.204296  ORF Transcript_72756/g.204296 Transcript_72756/m.204296 type:complete len:215 (-) Transcript_72756:380-1024(-)